MNNIEITTNGAGLPRQKIPIRYAFLITGLPIKIFISFFTNSWQIDGNNQTNILEAYRSNGKTEIVYRPSEFKRLLIDLDSENAKKSDIEMLPVDAYVYSDELAGGFDLYINFTSDKEQAIEDSLFLEWNPSTVRYKNEIDKNYNEVFKSTNLTKQESRKIQTKKRNKQWFTEFSKLIKDNPKYTTTLACNKLAKKHHVNPTTFRRIITNMKNS